MDLSIEQVYHWLSSPRNISYYNLCLAHASLQGKPPARAAGLIDHQWSIRELLTFGASNFSKIT
jgi:hypothetical protein